MEKTFLIAGNPSKLHIELAHQALSGSHRVLSTVDPGTEQPPIPEGLEEGLQYVEWNRRSPISARFVILQAANRQWDIDHAIITYTPTKIDTEPLHEVQSSRIEERIDYESKGYLFLLKDLLSYFSKRETGTITFVQQQAPETLPPIDSVVSQGFRGLGSALFQQYQDSGIVLRGIEALNPQNRQSAQYIVETVLENNKKTQGKWTKYTGKSGLFSFGK